MDTIKNFFLNEWSQLVVPCVVLVGGFIVGMIAKARLFRHLYRWSDRTKFRTEDFLIRAVDKPFTIWIMILALYLAVESSALPSRIVLLVGKVLLILWVLSFTFVAVSLAKGLVHHHKRKLQGQLPIASVIENLVTLTISIVGILIILNAFGISVTPILTALGVGGLAVALALQDTLTNLFAGFYLSLAGQIRVGDYIKLSSGEAGNVSDIGWRSTMIRALQNHLIIIPNAKLGQAIVTNYHLPEKRMSLSIPIAVNHDADPDMVEQILLDEARKGARHIPGLLARPEPFVRFIPSFNNASLNFMLICQAEEVVDPYLVEHELCKRVLRRFREAGIAPYMHPNRYESGIAKKA
ncbi:MAG: mechanosensitive ion channel family protein [Acidobacteria bacterium]|nr:mechanosensitive ion channel family protein [Acidobacteriota bacterium]